MNTAIPSVTPRTRQRRQPARTGQLPKFEGDLFAAKKGGQETEDHPDTAALYLIPTSEVPLTNFVRDECCRCRHCPAPDAQRRVSAPSRQLWSRLPRHDPQHQFDKVEMVQIVHPDTSYQALEDMTRHAETILQRSTCRTG